ncbi:alkaline phosphatase D family protein [Iamia sp.]|uniref:DUF7800 domain-containing protein n=1 Tax=Iamia sp. TaxID=2722710 RepID=UPI002CAFC7EC|nr:alkaline phosphatase D family protein [Iamia sp.]HXH56930.1 alkaline phosphatase D family protein [Iamia sp.]
MVGLVLGPLLRCVEGTSATVWVEVDAPCEVEVDAGPGRGTAHTVAVAGRHYALVVVRDLPPAAGTPYTVALDGEAVWPEAGADLPPSVIRTADPSRPVQVVFGSCRIDAPHEPPWDGPHTTDERGMGVDALDALARRLARGETDDRPDLLALLGDQIYADAVVDGHGERPDRGPDGAPPRSVADLDGYVEVYHRTWSTPHVRWLLSTVPSTMVFDDHDIVDDWNLSAAWLARIARQPWWDDRISGGLVSYWIYQHWGNLPPSALADDPVSVAVAGSDDATDLLTELADGWRLDRSDPRAHRWSTTRDIMGSATVRLVMVDTRNSRRLTEGDRAIVDDDEMAWIEDRARVDRDGLDHLLIGSPLPWLLPEGVHDVERSADALGGGRWGPLGRWLAERARRAGDLEHWASFGDSFEALAALITSVASGAQGPPPSSVLVLSGDVHFSYLAWAEVDTSDGSDLASAAATGSGGPDGGAPARVVQLVCSPLRNGVPANLQRVLRLASSRVGRLAGHLARRTAAHGDEPVDWRLDEGPWFGNFVASLTFDGRTATVRFERSRHDPDGRADLVTVHEERLAGPPQRAR